MEVRELIGTSIRTMVNVSTGVGESWTATSVRERVLRQRGYDPNQYSAALCFDLGFPTGFKPEMIRTTAGTRM